METVPVLFFALVFYVFEVQLLMQIIINRIAVMVGNRRWIAKVKWGTAGLITLANIAVFIIWIPSHMYPQPIPIFIAINTYWDRTSKAIILIVDASLNYYFLRVVKQRLVKNHRLTKYRPLVTYNARLMLVSIIMEATIIGLLPLPNELLYAQFHPVAYMMKLNIEMTMASLIKKIALSAVAEQEHMPQCAAHESALEHGTYSSASAKFRHSSAPGAEQDADRIRATTEAQVRVEEVLVGDGEREGFGDGGAYRGLGRGL